MDQALREISGHMRELGLGALSHATWHVHIHSMENPWWPQLSVLQAAHAAEILIKARIAEIESKRQLRRAAAQPAPRYDRGR